MLQHLRALEAVALQHRDALVIGVAAVLVILALLWATASRKRYIILRPSNETEAFVLQLHRIASALERIAARDEVPVFTSDEILREAPAQHPVERMEVAEHEHEPEPASTPPAARAATHGGVGSIFGFARGPELPNPFFRPK